jgi:RHS repeat-associated protein
LKHAYPKDIGILQGGIHYIRDAQGNIMATYRYSVSPGGAHMRLTDRPIYGSKRIGSYTRVMELAGEQIMAIPDYAQPMQGALMRYELNDHLGNVTAVVTGRLLPGNNAGSLYQAELISAQGYEPGGSLLPGRNYSSDSYRFGFNGKEKDDEVYGSTGTSYDFGERMNDPRVGKWLSIDPKASKYPHSSPYASMGNNPLLFIDQNGEDILVYLVYSDGARSKEPLIRIISDQYVHDFSVQTQLPNLEKPFGDPLLVNPFPAPLPTLTYDFRPIEGAMSSDAYMINAEAGFSFGGGMSGGLSAVLINKGEDQGFHLYANIGGQFGLDAGVGISAGPIDFNETNSANRALNHQAFEGWSQGGSVGYGGVSATTMNSYVDGKPHVPFFEKSESLYQGVLMGTGVGPTETGASYNFSKSTYLGSWDPIQETPAPAASTEN